MASLTKWRLLRRKLALETGRYALGLELLKNGSDLQPLSAAPDETDLGLDADNFGTDGAFITSTVTNGGGATPSASETARFQFALPPEYVAGTNVVLRVRCRISAARHTSASVDVEAFKLDGEGSVGSDICATAATSLTWTSFGDAFFTIAGTGLTAGNVLDIQITLATDDTNAGTGTNGHAEISELEVRLSIKG